MEGTTWLLAGNWRFDFGWSLQYRAIQGVKQADFWVAHSHEVMTEGQGLYSALLQVESGGRGYVATGDENYFSPYDAGASRLALHLDTLQRPTADNPRQQDYLDLLTPTIQRKIIFNQELIALLGSGILVESRKIESARGL